MESPRYETRQSDLAFLALVGGAVAIAYAPIAVRLSDVGPSATAFYRLALAWPFLWLWARSQGVLSGGPDPDRGSLRAFGLAGLLFAADLALWHASIRLTTVANATLLANFAPFVVSAGAWWLLKERLTARFLAGATLAVFGAALLLGASVQLSWRHLLGDVVGLLTALFYGGYLLAVKVLRQRFSTASIMFWSGTFCAPALWVAALISGEPLLPASARGWGVLLSLALVSQVLGQSLIAYSFAHLPASFSALSLLLQPVVATCLAWLILGEPVSMLQAFGGVIVLAGIFTAKRS